MPHHVRRSDRPRAARRIEQLFTVGSVAGLSERQLVDRFVRQRDEAAFEAIVTRHGPMVLGVCRQVLNNSRDVEDAFQATFLVLVRKAGTLRDRDLLANWLYGVALRLSLRARSVAARRRSVEGAELSAEPAVESRELLCDPETGLILHQEVARLPEKYRRAVVLCYLEGLTNEQAASQLGWPVGTLKARLGWARERLRTRLLRRGLVLSTAALTTVLTKPGQAAVSSALVEQTVKTGLAVVSGGGIAAGLMASNVAGLTRGVLTAMFWNQVKVVGLVLGAGVLATGAGVWAVQEESAREEQPARSSAPANASRSVATGGAPTGAAAAENHPVAEVSDPAATPLLSANPPSPPVEPGTVPVPLTTVPVAGPADEFPQITPPSPSEKLHAKRCAGVRVLDWRPGSGIPPSPNSDSPMDIEAEQSSTCPDTQACTPGCAARSNASDTRDPQGSGQTRVDGIS